MHANILKSDGSTLYITRDIAAAIDRKKRLFSYQLCNVINNIKNHLIYLFKSKKSTKLYYNYKIFLNC